MKRFVFALLATAAISAPVLADQALATAKNCMACHAVDKKLVGPAYKEVAKKFKNNILSKGGTEDPMVLYKQFRGHEPQPEALLKRAGLLK